MTEPNAMHQDAELMVLRYKENPRTELRDKILLECSSLVERIARRYSGIEQIEDLIQVGTIGLLNALKKYDPAAGVRFQTYASYLVAGEIKHHLRDRSQTIRQPAWLQEVRHKVQKAISFLQQSNGRTPNVREIAEHTGLGESAIDDVLATQELTRIASLDSSANSEDEGDSEMEKLDSADFCPEQLSMEDRLLLENAMSKLRDLERQVLVHFHFDAMNQTEIAAQLGISCNYVSHILRQSLSKLRKVLGDEAERDRVLKRQVEVVDYEVLDPVVGAYTEEYFDTRLQEEIHRAAFEEASVGVVLINFVGLDALKRFYGPTSVSDFLTDAAEFCRDGVRRLDLVCRFGPTGFGIILPSTGQNVTVVRQRLVSNLSRWMAGRYAENSPLRVEVGYAVFPDNGRSAVEIIEAARVLPLGVDQAAA